MIKAKILPKIRLFALAISLAGLTLSGANAQQYKSQRQLIEAGILYHDLAEDKCSADAGTTGQNIYVIGDSLTDGMNHESIKSIAPGNLDMQLTAAGWRVKGINATPGISIGGALAKIEADKDKIAQSDTVVVALGTNGRGGTDAQDNIPKMIEAINKAGDKPPKIYWMNAFNKEPSHAPLNAVIAAQASALNFSVIDFAAEVTANPAPYVFGENDPIHFTGMGYIAMGTFLTSKVGKVNSAGTGTESVSTVGNNTDYAGNEVWTADELTKVEANKPFYIKAGDEHDIPWQIIAAIHRNESGLQRVNAGNGQGIYQFLNAFGGPYPAGPVSDEEFQRQTGLVADRFNSVHGKGNKPANMGPVKKTGTPDNVVKDTFFSYNGRAGAYGAQAKALGFTSDDEAYEGSPYVMNRADAKRDPTVEPTKSNRTWGQITIDGGSVPDKYPANVNYGAWVYYTALAGAGGGGSCGGSSDGGVNAEGYAFPVEPQTKKGNGNNYFGSELPCPVKNCHTHTDPQEAFDLGREPFADSDGAKIYAIYDAEVIGLSFFDGIPGCFQFTLRADDGKSYYYTHLKEAKIANGDKVKAGQEIAKIGPPKCVNAGSNPSHLHIEMKDSTTGANIDGIVALINKLYEGLPE